MRRALLAGGAALILAAAAFTTSITSASARDPSGGHVAGSRGGAAPAARSTSPGRGTGAFRGGNIGPRVGMSGNAFRGNPGGQARAFVQGGQGHVAQHHVVRRHVRGPVVTFGSPYYYDYGTAYDDECYELQRVLTRSGWQYLRVYVCDE